MERFIEISYHITKASPNQWVVFGVDREGNRTGSKLFFDKCDEALQAYIDLNGYTEIKPEDILYIGSAQ